MAAGQGADIFWLHSSLPAREDLAVLPRTRAMETPNSLAFKFEPLTAQVRARLEQDSRVGTTTMQVARWFTFELGSDADLHAALDWLGRAYEAAGKGAGKSAGKSAGNRKRGM